MRTNPSGSPPDGGIRKPLTIMAATLPMILLTLALLFGRWGADSPARTISLILTFLFISTICLIMVRSGKTDKPRMILYVTYAVAFVISFISTLVRDR